MTRFTRWACIKLLGFMDWVEKWAKADPTFSLNDPETNAMYNEWVALRNRIRKDLEKG